MKLAARKAEIAACPYASEEAIGVLGAAYEPPVKSVKLGPERALKLGEETVLYRHDKTFVNQTALAVNVDADADPGVIDATLKSVKEYEVERVGETLVIDMLAVTQAGGSREAFVELARRAREETGKPLVLRSDDPEALAAAAAAVEGSHGVLAAATPETVDRLLPVAKETGHALALTANDLDALLALAAKVKQEGFGDVVLEFRTESLAELFQTNSIARRAAIKDSFKPLGYPFLRFVSSPDLVSGTVEAVNEIGKYGGICVLPSFDPAQMAALMTLRMNLFTDPQKPIQVEPKIYPVGEPTADSPVFVTTNFSLTYFIVGGEIENSGISAWLVVPECEGMSVLTAWAAGKFSGASVASFCKQAKLDELVTRREIIIPGYAAAISGDLEEGLPGWSVVVGPQEAADLESFIKAKVA
jgi:acetyl-CoA decarbonylase/synthase complex subunit gamma